MDGNKFELADTAADLDDINDIVNLYQLEAIDMSCDLIAAINSLTVAVEATAQAGCGTCGSQVDEESKDTPPVGPTTDFPDVAAYDEYKCRAANWIQDGLEDVFSKLIEYDVGFWTTTTLAIASSLMGSIVATTLLATPYTLVGGAVIAFVSALIIGSTIDLEDIRDELVSSRTSLICEFYSGSDADGSRSNYLGELSAGPLNAAEVGLVGLILVNTLVNKMYEFDAAIDVYPIGTACDCGSDPCPFTFTRGTGTPTYDNVPFVISSVPFSGFHNITMVIPSSDTGCDGGNWCCEFDSETGVLTPSGTWARELYCWATGPVQLLTDYKPDFYPIGEPLKVSQVSISNPTPFTITMRVTGTAGLCTVGPEEGCG